MSIQSIAIFCGSKAGKNLLYQQHAILLGQILAEKKITIIYGGGNKGLMGAVADGAIAYEGKITGIIPEVLKDLEHLHEDISEKIVVADMHVRKKLLYEKSDAVIILPGGFGTLDELFETLTWNTLKIHDKKIFFLNIDGFYDHLIAHINKMHEEGFLYSSPVEQFTIINHPNEIGQYL